MTLNVDISAPGGLFTPAAKGDAQQVTANFTIASGSAALSCTGATPFVSADTGKHFCLPGAGASGAVLTGTLTFVSSSSVTLSVTAGTALSSSSQVFTWGTDDAPAFNAFNTWAVANQAGQQVVLNIPNSPTVPTGIYLFGSGDFTTNHWGRGIKNFVANGNNALLFANGIGYFVLGGVGQVQNNLNSARLASVAAGASTVQLIDSAVGTAAARISLFAANNWVVVSGCDLQSTPSAYGYPANSHFFEFKQIQSVNSGATTVTFTSPLQNSYKQTWASINIGTASEVDPGGPATIYALNSSWDCDHTYNNLQINQVGLQMAVNGRNIIFNGGKIYDPAGLIPSQNLSWQVNGIDLTGCGTEVDKLVTTASWSNVVGTFSIDVQSSSVDQMNLTNCTVHELNGTPKRLNINGVTITDALSLGAYAYGRTDQVIATNCTMLRVINNGRHFAIPGDFPISMSGGTIASPIASGAIPFPPGTWAFFDGTYAFELLVKTIDQSSDVSNVYMQTTSAGGLPLISVGGPPGSPGTPTMMRAHACPSITMTNCSGCPDAVSISKAPPGWPVWSYSFRTYTETTSYTGTPEPGGVLHMLTGRLKKITINVISPSATALKISYAFNVVDMNTNIASIWSALTFDLTAAGTRIITPSGITGAQPGDSGLAFPSSGTWSCNQVSLGLIGSVVGPFTFTVEMIADQGLYSQAVNPLRSRIAF